MNVAKSWRSNGVDKFTSKQNRNIKVKRGRQEWNDESQTSDDYPPQRHRSNESVERDAPESLDNR